MDSELVKKGLEFTRRRKKWIIVVGAVGFSGYGVYKIYRLPSVERKRKRVMKLFESIVSMVELVSDSAETITLVWRDLKEFLKSDSDELPNSLKQLSKVARAQEFSESVARICQCMTVGVLRGYRAESGRNEIQEAGGVSIPEKVMDKLVSSAGQGFVSVVVGSFARNLVLGFYASGDSGEGLSENGNLGESYEKSGSAKLPTWLSVVLDDKGRVLVADCIKTFVSTAVAVYLDKTMDINFYDEIFSGLTNPNHQNKMTDILVSLCNGAIETLVKTSHQVLTASKQGHESQAVDSISIAEVSSSQKKIDFQPEAHAQKDMNEFADVQNSGWVNSVSSTLAVPRNRKFVLDVTGRVTYETVRSAIELFLWKTCEALKKSLNVVHGEVVGRGFEVVRYVGAKSSVIFALCIALFLHIFGCSRVLLHA